MTGTSKVKFLTSLVLVACGALLVAACGGGRGNATAAPAQGEPSSQAQTVSVANSSLGQILVDSGGRTLYLFKADSGTTSACGGTCAVAWPPLLAAGTLKAGGGADESLVGSAKRADGTRQVTYAGHPLYLYAGDRKPGDVNGQGVRAFGAAWFALSPAGTQDTGSPSGTPGGTNSTPIGGY